MDKCFFKTASRIDGVGFDTLQSEGETPSTCLPQRNIRHLGQYHWRSGGELICGIQHHCQSATLLATMTNLLIGHLPNTPMSRALAIHPTRTDEL
ncbi:Glutamate synthase [NADPH] large chain (EC [uncultured Gammaproteobacteria bacterium]|nr:Glutamate synthase [NADPH] large chain (EC [uncultured Gammaproteobacteria bacterium]